MAPNILAKKLIAAGITASTDGHLRDFISRGLYQAAIGTIDGAIERRKKEAEFLDGFRHEIMRVILEEQEV